ncbi:histone-like nucleoid-structuring protein Lsr2 [Agromyces mariniharenae]|uniref:Lsr2 family protein n=1 Tax=Agromyces mariniharenae TaxID=2604423 RepID=A0A5S4UWC1_9MICO|nr:Lsr2 family protein [Agromyces mariniharenae]TYL51177.1 Lsr2 family protein [Agromyces mariniharenae]
MAKKTVVTLVDDIDGSEAIETLAFSFDGTSYEIDLSKSNAKAFRKAMQSYVDAGRKTSVRTGRRPASRTSDARDIRAWAAANGVDVPARGRIPASVQEQYRAAAS